MAVTAAISSALVRRETQTFRDGRQQGHVEMGKVKQNLCLLIPRRWERSRAGSSTVSQVGSVLSLKGNKLILKILLAL